MTKRSRNGAQTGASPCIWMEAGVIDYWLCDRAFNCETCPLDMALRGRFPDRAQPVARTPWVPPTIQFHPSHLWINPANETEWAMGLDFHALHAFTDPPTLSLPRPGRRIKTGQTLLSMLIDGDALRWPAPMDVIVLERNDNWGANARELRESPYSEGWSLLVKLPRQFERSVWLDADAIQASCAAERSALKDVCHEAAQHDTELGHTAADGGALLAPPDRLIPRPMYLTFLRKRWGLLPPESGF